MGHLRLVVDNGKQFNTDQLIGQAISLVEQLLIQNQQFGALLHKWAAAQKNHDKHEQYVMSAFGKVLDEIKRRHAL